MFLKNFPLDFPVDLCLDFPLELILLLLLETWTDLRKELTAWLRDLFIDCEDHHIVFLRNVNYILFTRSFGYLCLSRIVCDVSWARSKPTQIRFKQEWRWEERIQQAWHTPENVIVVTFGCCRGLKILVLSHSVLYQSYQCSLRVVMRQTNWGMVAILTWSVDDDPDPVCVPNLRTGTEVRKDEGGSWPSSKGRRRRQNGQLRYLDASYAPSTWTKASTIVSLSSHQDYVISPSTHHCPLRDCLCNNNSLCKGSSQKLHSLSLLPVLWLLQYCSCKSHRCNLMSKDVFLF